MRAALILLLALLAWRADAEVIVTSPAAERVSISLYRDPSRGSGEIDRNWPGGFALITETRTVTLPVGEAVVRFEGVADGILAESAILTGLPGGVRQKNRNAEVLSPAALIDFALGKRVHLRRTNRATGAVIEEEALVRAGPDGGVVIQGPRGVEALHCSGLPETLLFDDVPAGLSDKPVLSVNTRSAEVLTATVTLSYLAGGFDWGADYVATLSADGRAMDLFAWATLANGTGQSFEQAETNAIAGRLRRTSENGGPTYTPMLRLGCWPMGTTTDGLSAGDVAGYPPPPPPPPPPPSPPAAPMAYAENIVVTGSRMMAQQEELGDLKLYRIPEPVTVAAKSQKQVAMIDRRAVPVEQIVRFRAHLASPAEDVPGKRVIKAVNREKDGLGLPLPSGQVRVFSRTGDGVMLTGRAELDDLAVGEDVEIAAGTVTDVRLMLINSSISAGSRDIGMTATLANASPYAQTVELQLVGGADLALRRSRPALRRKDGIYIWRGTLPAGERVRIDYVVRQSAD